MAIGITPDKVCKHLESWGKGGFSMETSKHKYKEAQAWGWRERWPDGTWIRGPDSGGALSRASTQGAGSGHGSGWGGGEHVGKQPFF